MTILQITTPSEIRGRVFGLLGTIAAGLMPVGMGLAGVVADMTGNNIPAIFMACGAIVSIVTIIIAMGREFREYLAFEPEDENK
jgi:hypothetical protein